MLALVATIATLVFVSLLHTMMLRIALKWVAKSKPRFRNLLLAAVTSLLVLGGFNALISALLGGQPTPLLALLYFLFGIGLVAAILRALLKDPENVLLSYGKALGIAALSLVMTFATIGLMAIFAIRLLGSTIS
jgi:hypothetical protein